MTARETTRAYGNRPLGLRITAAILAALLVACFQASPFASAYAANSKSSDAVSALPAKNRTNSLSTPANSQDDDEEDEGDAAEDQKQAEVAEKRAAVKTVSAQASATRSSLKTAKATYDTAAAHLREENTRLTAAEEEYKEKASEIVTLQENLTEYVVDMYKQGGSTPYLDVMLGATSYREFLVSWNMTTRVSQYGQEVVDEKRRIQEEIEEKIKSCKEKVKEAEEAKSLADAKLRQTEATLLALIVQVARLNLEIAELDGTKKEIAKARDKYNSAQEKFDEALASGLAGEKLLSGGGYFTHPCPDSTVSSGFGYRAFDNAVHEGIDFAADEGTPYYAAESGTVKAATNGGGYNGGAGNWIVIDHGNGVVTKYMHSLITFVSPGDRVVRGQNIGLVGSTGQSTGAHLHFQVEMRGVPVNPANYL